jgi:hypothetical protein
MLKGPKAEKKQFYLNPIAMLFLMATQMIKILIAGRGFGKSFLIGVSIMLKVRNLPKSRGLLIGATYTQILTNILLPMKNAWATFGYREWDGKDGDYIVGKRPPVHWDEPYQKPDRYENVITWWNGTTIVLGSMDRPQLIRGGNYDWSKADEGLLIKKDQYEQIIIPTIRGSHIIFQGKPGHLSQEIYSSMPYGTLGSWLLDKKIEAENPENDTFYIEGTSWHNRVILTDKVLKMWKRTMSKIIYMIEVMNMRVRQFGDVFYPSLKDKHWYTDTFNYAHIDSLGTDPDKLKPDCRWDKDFDPKKPITITHDFGAFNCILVDQEYEKDPWFHDQWTVRFLNYLFASHPETLQDLAMKFCKYYKYTENKTVYQYGDKSGNKAEANSKYTYFEEFAKILEANGFRVIMMPIGDVGHLARHQFIIEMHREEDPRLPVIRYNMNNCKDLRIALESTPMKADKKDKGSEKNKKISQQHATHPTDAHDYRLWWGFKSLTNETVYHSPVSFGGG